MYTKLKHEMMSITIHHLENSPLSLFPIVVHSCKVPISSNSLLCENTFSLFVKYKNLDDEGKGKLQICSPATKRAQMHPVSHNR